MEAIGSAEERDLSLSESEYEKAAGGYAASARGLPPFVAGLLSGPLSVRDLGRTITETRAMLVAAFVVVQRGNDAIAEIRDPYGTGPFGYNKLDDGFELTCAIESRGKPLKLVTGPRAMQ